MTPDVAKWFDEHRPQKFELASRYVNPTFVKVLKLIGLDKSYTRADGCYLFDAAGNRYLDCLSGYCVLTWATITRWFVRRSPTLSRRTGRTWCRWMRRHSAAFSPANW